MAFDLPSIIIGLVVGGLAVGITIEVMGRTRQVATVTSKLTSAWRLSEFRDPTIVAREVLDVAVPDKATVLASGLVAPDIVARAKVRSVPAVRAEFALDRASERAILFVGGIRPDALALVTVDQALVERLRSEAQTLETRAMDYVERQPVRTVLRRIGAVVETEGIVRDVVPYKGAFLMRVADGDDVIGVQVSKDPTELRDERVLVRGKVVKEGGYATLVAAQVHPVR